jgi:hypothetical protein
VVVGDLTPHLFQRQAVQVAVAAVVAEIALLVEVSQVQPAKQTLAAAVAAQDHWGLVLIASLTAAMAVLAL